MKSIGIFSAFVVGVLCASSMAVLAQHKAPPRATHWEVKFLQEDELEKHLPLDGWEPLAVTTVQNSEHVWYRKRV